MSRYLQLSVDRESDASLASQVFHQVRQLICDDVLHAGVRLPSSRQLAEDLGVSRSVVVEAYQQLVAEGWLLSSQRSGTWVAAAHGYRRSDAAEPAGGAIDGVLGGAPGGVLGPALRPLGVVDWDLRFGGADVTGFPRREWLASLQTVLRNAGQMDLDYPPVAGHPALIAELADYLGRARGVRATTSQFMITAGFAHGLSLVCNMLVGLGFDALALEDPGQPGQQALVENIGLRTIPIPVDEDGIDVAALAASEARAVLVTPAHQFPTGAPLGEHRRRALLEWAQRVDGLIVEDDYDGEFWYASDSRSPSLQSTDPARVAYGGTASKTLAPGLRLGWLVVPIALADELRRAREPFDLGAGSIDQLAYADFLRTGRLDRHLRRVRARYSMRQRTLAAVVAEHLPDARLAGRPAGMHAYLRLPPNLDEHELVAAALRRRVLVHGASRYRLSGGRRPPPALVIGYTTQPKSALVEAVQVLGAAARELRARPRVGVPVLAATRVRSRPA